MPVLRRAWFPAGLLCVGLVGRAVQAQGALLYPDGYQYLLMARGIADHLRPVLQLGPGGEHWVPNVDASLKPLFPGLIALAHTLGVGWTDAARLISVASGGAVVCLTGVLASRLSRSQAAGAAAAILVLLDPASRYWAAFSSPDSLGQALTLGCVLAVLSRRPRLAGSLAALAAFARPELGLLLLAGGAALMVRAATRDDATRFISTALVVASAVLVGLRPPLTLQPAEVAIAAAGALVAASLALLARPSAGVVAGLAGLGAVALHSPALGHLTVRDAAVAASCAVGLVLARRTRAASVIAVSAAALAVVYDAKNGTSSRYMTQLVPLGVLGAAAGIGALTVPRIRALGVAVVTAAVGIASVSVAPALPGADMFGQTAAALPTTKAPITTAATDAYGFLLYPRPVLPLTTRSRGLLLMDATARAYAPEISAHGRVVVRLAARGGFLRPDGRIDRKPTLLIDGQATSAG